MSPESRRGPIVWAKDALGAMGHALLAVAQQVQEDRDMVAEYKRNRAANGSEAGGDNHQNDQPNNGERE